jgi:hypothetical protein
MPVRTAHMKSCDVLDAVLENDISIPPASDAISGLVNVTTTISPNNPVDAGIDVKSWLETVFGWKFPVEALRASVTVPLLSTIDA